MAGRQTINDWKTVEPDDWKTVSAAPAPGAPGSREWAAERQAQIEKNTAKYTKDEPGFFEQAWNHTTTPLDAVRAIYDHYANKPSQWKAVSDVLGTKRGSPEEKAAIENAPDLPNPMALELGGGHAIPDAALQASRGNLTGAAGTLAGAYVASPAIAYGTYRGLRKVGTKQGRQEMKTSTTQAVERGADAIATRAAGAAPDPVKHMTQALRPTAPNVHFAKQVLPAMREINESSAELLGRQVTSTSELLDVLPHAKQRVWAQVEQAMGPQLQAQLSGDPIAAAIKKSVSSKLRHENPDAAARIDAIADTYAGRTFSIQKLEDFLEDANKELDGYYGKYPGKKRAALVNDPETAHTVAMADTTRRMIEDWIEGTGTRTSAPKVPPAPIPPWKMFGSDWESRPDAARIKQMYDEAVSARSAAQRAQKAQAEQATSSGEGAGIRDLKRRYGALSNMESEAYRRKNVADRQSQESLTQQLSKIHKAGKIVGGTFKAVRGKLIEGGADIAEGIAGGKAADALRRINSTDGLIDRAFSQFTERPIPVNIQRVQPKGLLGPGPQITPPPAAAPDPSGITVTTGPPLQPKVKGLLPASSTIPLPAAPDPSGVRSVPATFIPNQAGMLSGSALAPAGANPGMRKLQPREVIRPGMKRYNASFEHPWGRDKKGRFKPQK